MLYSRCPSLQYTQVGHFNGCIKLELNHKSLYKMKNHFEQLVYLFKDILLYIIYILVK